eukprot:CAMPEP_0173402062 /NCGR_PEP_ID=MMETSP1356-20130122/52819_1 /TAXON_ID=77927 ORGANISM="Hemiselmis virescens, Strain PCC157" /NCGR_SAMPLE_ID=MMETSP1356 /ASSEMBLY_ACC=CAM_ASM_000847 /LENGTH=86 /DNA_ID=CAMNT_0014362341 /DNA_START=172 /DNA_END=429 /DNA_ORIENTATION=-
MMGGHSTVVLYLAALCMILGAASIDPPEHVSYASSRLEGELCTSLAERLPCDQAAGPWEHICKASVSVSCTTVSHAVQMSREMPEH